MREIASQEITNAVARLFIEANCRIREDVFDAWVKAFDDEEPESLAREAIGAMIMNAKIAWEDGMPICQDTGQPVVLVEQGDEVKVTGASLADAVNEGVEQGGREGYLRRSVVADPLDRENAGSFGPAVIHHRIVPGETFRITLYPAGCGCEQMNAVAMFPPSDEEGTIRGYVLQRVREAGSRPCPPNIIGVGIGGDLEQSAYLARIALLRPINRRNKHERYAAIEKGLWEEINRLGTGPQGLGGKTTVLAVNVEASGCHRANLPVAVAFNCHIGRWKTWEYGEKGTEEKDRRFFKRLAKEAERIDLFRGYRKVSLPLSEETVAGLSAGDRVLLDGVVYTARDAAHRRLVRLIEGNKDLPFDMRGQVIYYVGPTPPRPGCVIGSAGPTTSFRMDPYTPLLLANGIRGMIGKGFRGPEVVEAIKRHRAVYFVTFAGAGALLSRHIAGSAMVAFEDLGTEAIRRLELRDFPVIVACDAQGRDIYAQDPPDRSQGSNI